MKTIEEAINELKNYDPDIYIDYVRFNVDYGHKKAAEAACIVFGARVEYADTIGDLITDLKTQYSSSDELSFPITDIIIEDDASRRFIPGMTVRHFKAEFNTPEQELQNNYYYKILGTGKHSETGEKLMIYQALFNDHYICARPYSMFESKVDKEKYPNVKQEYRFQIIHNGAERPYLHKVTVNNLINALNKIDNKELFVTVSQDPDNYSYLQSVYVLTDPTPVALDVYDDKSVVALDVDDDKSVVALIGSFEEPLYDFDPNKIL